MGSTISYDTCRELLREKIYAKEGRRVSFRLDPKRDPIIKGLVKHQHYAYHHFIENLFAKALMDALREKAKEFKQKYNIGLEIFLEPYEYKKLGRKVYVRYASLDPNTNPEADERPVDTSGKRVLPRRARIKKLSYNTSARVIFKARLERPPGSGRYLVRPDDFEKPERSRKLPLRTKIGEIPVMVGSGFCSLYPLEKKNLLDAMLYSDRRDPGGYIIHEGTDRAIIMKETSAHRVFIIARPKEDSKKRINAVSSRVAAYNEVRKTYVEVERRMSLRAYITRPKFTAYSEIPEDRESFEVPALAVFEALLALIKSEKSGVPPEKIEVPREELYTFVLASIAPFGELAEEFDKQISIRKSQADAFREEVRKKCLERAERKLRADYERRVIEAPPTKEDVERKAEEIFEENKRRFVREYVARVFLQDFFEDLDRDDPNRNPHMAKALVLGNVLRRILLRHKGYVEYDDRDHYRFKRVVSAGDLLAMTTMEGLKEYVKTLYDSIGERLQDVITEIRIQEKISGSESDKIYEKYLPKVYDVLARNLRHSVGDKVSKFNEKVDNIIGTGRLLSITGLTEVIERTNHYYLLALLRRIKVLMEKKRKNPEVRDLHPTQRGRMCPDETPDGATIGIQKHMALGAMFTQGLLKHERELLFAILHEIGLSSVAEALDVERYLNALAETGRPPAQVVLDGEVIGVVDDPERFVDEFRRIRRFGIAYLLEKKEYNNLLRISPYSGVLEGKLVDILKRYEAARFVANAQNELQTFFDNAIKEVNIHYDERENIVRITADGGRMRRALITIFRDPEDAEFVKRNFLEGIIENPDDAFVEINGVYVPSDELFKAVIKFARESGMNARDMLVQMGVIEYLDAQEEEYAYVALRPHEITAEHTHLEVHPARIFGVSASLLPFQEHNHSPRNIYGAGMAKQAIGLPYADFPIRFMSSTRILFYPQVPLVTTKGAELSGYHERPYGENMIVAVQVMEGYNMRDAVVLNQGSVERGLARDYLLKRVELILKGSHIKGEGIARYTQIGIVLPRQGEHEVQSDKILVLGTTNTKKPHAFRLLGEDGIVEPGTLVKHEDVLVGRSQPSRFSEDLVDVFRKLRDTSETMKEHFPMYVNDVVLFLRSSDLYAYVRLRDHRPPSLGDKFTTRQGQKGVVGMLYRPEDVPYTADGIIPDLILNPHAMPSRMTLGLIIEGLASLLALKLGKPFDGTPFRFKDPRVLEEFRGRFKDRDVRYISVLDILQKRLKDLGFNPYGERTMYDGRTGRMLRRKIFVVPLHYRRLKHEVRDKMHMRARGKYQLHVRQPTEGKARGGGLRVGEMERDTFVGHGASFVLLDRMLVNSDETTIYVCRNCGGIGYYKREGDREVPVCPFCGKPDLYPVKVPYPFYILYVTLLAMGIRPKIKLQSRFDRSVF